MSASFSRRDFFAYGGSVLAGMTLGEWGRRQLAHADARAERPDRRGSVRWATSVCRECPAACGVRVRLIDEVPVKLEGNPLCPIGRGRLCASGQASLEAYYDPDRLVGPARRTGRRGEHRWTPISWPEATALLASRLTSAPLAPETRPVAIAAEEQGPLADAWARFWSACGGRAVWTPGPTSARLRPSLVALTGVERDPLFDVEHASYILSFGAPLAETWLSPVWTQRSFGRFRRQPGRSRGRLVQVDVHRSVTARKADQWLALTPEQQVVFAYGIAAIIVRENRQDRRFLERFPGTLAEFERDLVRTYLPNDVSSLTGVPVVTILRLARELSAASQSLAIVDADAPRDLVDAVFALNALIGAFDRPGGVFASSVPPPPAVEDATGPLREIASGRLRPSVLALRDGSALRAPGALMRADAFAAADFVVSFSPFLDQTTALADLLLPAHTSLETWHTTRAATAVPGEATAIASPAVAPRLETRDPAETLAATAAAIGGRVASACSWTSAEELVGAHVERLAGVRRGGVYASVYETEWLLQLQKGGWWTPGSETPRAFRAAVLEAGGWGDPFFQPGELRATLETGRGLTFPAIGAAPALAAAARHRDSGPHVVDGRQRGRDTGFPFRLVLFPTAAALAANPNQPALYELLGQPEGLPWRSWVEVAPEPARALGLQTGSTVRLVSPTGAMQAVVMVVEGMQPDVVALAHVPALPGGGRWARQIGTDSGDLWPRDDKGSGTRVRLERV
jgi:anaerobic selenocysteine-containing dehydrogenase